MKLTNLVPKFRLVQFPFDSTNGGQASYWASQWINVYFQNWLHTLHLRMSWRRSSEF